MNTKPIYISENDSLSIRSRLPAFTGNKRFRDTTVLLQAELDRAIIVNRETLSSDVVALGSLVEVLDLSSSERATYTLTLPETADVTLNRISVFSPLGTALIGFAQGDEFDWQMPVGVRRYRIETVRHQHA